MNFVYKVLHLSPRSCSSAFRPMRLARLVPAAGANLASWSNRDSEHGIRWGGLFRVIDLMQMLKGVDHLLSAQPSGLRERVDELND
jgi:hypothetical protein